MKLKPEDLLIEVSNPGLDEFGRYMRYRITHKPSKKNVERIIDLLQIESSSDFRPEMISELEELVNESEN